MKSRISLALCTLLERTGGWSWGLGVCFCFFLPRLVDIWNHDLFKSAFSEFCFSALKYYLIIILCPNPAEPSPRHIVVVHGVNLWKHLLCAAGHMPDISGSRRKQSPQLTQIKWLIFTTSLWDSRGYTVWGLICGVERLTFNETIPDWTLKIDLDIGK